MGRVASAHLNGPWRPQRRRGSRHRRETNRVVSTTTVGRYPARIAADQNAIWVINGQDETISRIDPQTRQVVHTFAPGSTPTDLAPFANALWVATPLTNRVLRLDESTDEVTAQISAPNPLFLDSARGKLWVVGETVQTLDPATRKRTLVFDASLPNTQPAADANFGSIVVLGRRLFISSAGMAVTHVAGRGVDSGMAVTRIDASTNAVHQSKEFGGRGAESARITAAKGSLWLTCPTLDRLLQVNPGSLGVISKIAVGERPVGVSFGAGSLWVANSGDGTVMRVARSCGRSQLDIWHAEDHRRRHARLTLDAPRLRSAPMSRLEVALSAAAVLLAGVAAIPAYGVDAVANGKLAFVADEAGKPQVFTINPDGTGLTRLTNRPNGAGEYGLAWSPDASSLLMVLSGSHDLIYKADRDGAAVRRLSRCAGNCLGDGSPTYTRSGAKIAFERAFGPVTNDNAAAVAILTMNADGSGLRQLTQTKKPTSTEDHTPSWSPDGKRIAFQRYNTTAQPAHLSAIYVMNADGTQLRRLTPRSVDASNPRWSRDGTRIAFNDYAEDIPNKSANVYTIRTDGTRLQKVTHYTGGTKRAFVNDWSPDGRQIVYHLIGDTVNDLYVVNADGTNTRALTRLGPKANPRHSTWGTAH